LVTPSNRPDSVAEFESMILLMLSDRKSEASSSLVTNPDLYPVDPLPPVPFARLTEALRKQKDSGGCSVAI